MKCAQKNVAAKSKKIKKASGPSNLVESHASGMFKCPHCPRVFEKSCSLGGHTSKAHPLMSKIYKRKMEIRNRRSHERCTLQKAKEILEERDLGIHKGGADYNKQINKNQYKYELEFTDPKSKNYLPSKASFEKPAEFGKKIQEIRNKYHL